MHRRVAADCAAKRKMVLMVGPEVRIEAMVKLCNVSEVVRKVEGGSMIL